MGKRFGNTSDVELLTARKNLKKRGRSLAVDGAAEGVLATVGLVHARKNTRTVLAGAMTAGAMTAGGAQMGPKPDPTVATRTSPLGGGAIAQPPTPNQPNAALVAAIGQAQRIKREAKVHLKVGLVVDKAGAIAVKDLGHRAMANPSVNHAIAAGDRIKRDPNKPARTVHDQTAHALRTHVQTGHGRNHRLGALVTTTNEGADLRREMARGDLAGDATKTRQPQNHAKAEAAREARATRKARNRAAAGVLGQIDLLTKACEFLLPSGKGPQSGDARSLIQLPFLAAWRRRRTGIVLS